MTEFKTLPAISNSITQVVVKHFYGVAECVLSQKFPYIVTNWTIDV